jgi:prophage tail gpP-like protein
MSYEVVTVVANARSYEGWESFECTYGIDQAARSFTLRVSEATAPTRPHFQRFPLLPNTEVSVFSNGELVVAGYVDEYRPSYSGDSHEITIIGRGSGADYVDCSVFHPTGRFENMTVLEIARELDKFNIGIHSDVDVGEPIPWFQTRYGSTPWAEMMRILPEMALTMMGMPDGSILLTRAASKRHSGELVEGQNIEEASATLSAWDRFSYYAVGGQSSWGTDEDRTEPLGYQVDNAVRRFRPVMRIAAAETDPKRARRLAAWHSARAAGNSITATVTVPGFRDKAGAIWIASQRIYTYAPSLQIDQDMVIKSVRLTQSESGTRSSLELVDPQSFGGDPSAVNNSGSGYLLDLPDIFLGAVNTGSKGPR